MERQQTLRELLEEKGDIHSPTELRVAIGGSAAHACNLWSGRQGIGMRIMVRILTACPKISAYDLTHVVEAKSALVPAPEQKPRKKPAWSKKGREAITEAG